MRRKLASIGIAYAAAWAVVWWFATDPARSSEDILGRLEARPGFDDGLAIEKELAAHYRRHPRQAYADWGDHPGLRGVIAGACATVPEARSLVEEALESLPPVHRVYTILCLSTGGSPTFSGGSWTGDERLVLPRAWEAYFRMRRERDPSAEIVALYATVLFENGWNPDAADLFRLAREDRRPPDVAAATLAAWARRPGTVPSIYAGLERAEIPDAVASQLLASGGLAADPGYRAFVEGYALSPQHAVVTGGAFAVLARQFPDLQDRLWQNARSAPPGSRLPLMLSLGSGTTWPSPYLRWWVMAWRDEVPRHGPHAEHILGRHVLPSLPGWILAEKDEDLRRALNGIFERLRSIQPR